MKILAPYVYSLLVIVSSFWLLSLGLRFPNKQRNFDAITILMMAISVVAFFFADALHPSPVYFRFLMGVAVIAPLAMLVVRKNLRRRA